MIVIIRRSLSSGRSCPLELVPGERLVYTDSFDDPNLPGEMKVTVTLKAVSVGTEVNIEQQGVPDVIPAKYERNHRAVPKFVTIGYGDREGYDRTPPAIRDAAHAHDAKLREHGVLMGIAGAPVQVRNHQAGRVQTSEGPFMASAMPVAGFAVIEAPDLAHAIDMVSNTPCAVAYGVVEVWPLETA